MEVKSTASEGVGTVTVELELGYDTSRALSDVKAAVDRIQSFPTDAERPLISLASSRSRVTSFIVHGHTSEKNLRQLAEQSRDELLNHPGITQVDLSGVRPFEISIEVPERKLREYGFTIDQIAEKIRAANVELPAGGVKTSRGEVLLRTSERHDYGTDFEKIIVLSRPDGSEVKVGDIAQVKDGFAETDQESFFYNDPAILINVYRTGKEKPLEVAGIVYKHIEKRKKELPPGIGIAPWINRSEIYGQRVDLLRRNANLGLILVLLVLGLFLTPRLAGWVTLGIPISFVGALLLMPAMDVSINMISLFAFIVTLGMVVDDAIIVGEAIYKHHEQGMPWAKAAVIGAKEVARPVTFAIVTTVVAFMPLLFVPGVMGKIFRVIPLIVIAVLVNLFVGVAFHFAGSPKP